MIHFNELVKQIKTRTPRLVRRATDVLSHLPKDRVVTTTELAKELGVQVVTFRGVTKHPELKSYRIDLNSQKTYWGNPETVAAAKKAIRK